MSGSDDSGSERCSTVYVVATTHPDDPHAKVEGVYRNEEDAMQGERDAIRGFGAITAETYEMEVR